MTVPEKWTQVIIVSKRFAISREKRYWNCTSSAKYIDQAVCRSNYIAAAGLDERSTMFIYVRMCGVEVLQCRRLCQSELPTAPVRRCPSILRSPVTQWVVPAEWWAPWSGGGRGGWCCWSWRCFTRLWLSSSLVRWQGIWVSFVTSDLNTVAEK